MKNIVTTIPKSRFKTWAECETELLSSDGEEGGFWTVATNHLPTETPIGNLCYMVFDGFIRGYMDCVNVGATKDWPYHAGSKVPHVFVLANWHPISPIPMTGFQGWRYTPLRP